VVIFGTRAVPASNDRLLVSRAGADERKVVHPSTGALDPGGVSNHGRDRQRERGFEKLMSLDMPSFGAPWALQATCLGPHN